MNFKLIKKLVVLNKGAKNEKKFYVFYLKLDNGEELRVLPNTYKDKKGNVKSNYDILSALATDLPF